MNFEMAEAAGHLGRAVWRCRSAPRLGRAGRLGN